MFPPALTWITSSWHSWGRVFDATNESHATAHLNILRAIVTMPSLAPGVDLSSHSSPGIGRRALHGSVLTSNLPQPNNLLEQYWGLVASGKINYDENQVRVIMQVRLQMLSNCVLYLDELDEYSSDDFKRSS